MGFCTSLLSVMPRVRGMLLDAALHLHNVSYKAATRLAVSEEGGTHPKHRIIGYHQWFLDHINPGSTVLDIGCGAGHLSRSLSLKASRVFAVDIVPGNIATAMQTPHGDNITYLCADATRMDLSAYAVDHVVLSNVLEHIRDRTDFLRCIAPVLAAQCSLLLRVPLLDRCWLPIYKRERGVEWRLDPTHFTEYTEEELLVELSAANLELAAPPRIRHGELYAVIVSKSDVKSGAVW